MNIGEGEGPIEANFGSTPVRLNPDAGAEVVWAQRICPVRARINNVPWPESGFRHGDVVLHDGAAVGYRLSDGQEKPVFNAFELFERSPFATFGSAVKASRTTRITTMRRPRNGFPSDASASAPRTRRKCAAP
jgi:hypothetical protein